MKSPSGKEKTDPIHWWTDALSVPAMTVLCYVLMKWLPTSIAFAVAVGLLLLSFTLFERRRFSLKRFAVILLVGLLVAYLYATLFKL